MKTWEVVLNAEDHDVSGCNNSRVVEQQMEYGPDPAFVEEAVE